eukprot:CAMPEP_0197584900 /NCGR_PEP_ID=MMETSP1326-20131121/7373_1 /TAXON_ID=1155430 /ORGANISM="Genus nov. species nov., Strain RCC2288" /LENGTH=73 /DNA_ID=CAMNT_0043149331 /DNA_START=56 /DNA_END=274 /DNA_ORIENTATION=+
MQQQRHQRWSLLGVGGTAGAGAGAGAGVGASAAAGSAAAAGVAGGAGGAGVADVVPLHYGVNGDAGAAAGGRS